jgi:hypothetical protein
MRVRPVITSWISQAASSLATGLSQLLGVHQGDGGTDLIGASAVAMSDHNHDTVHADLGAYRSRIATGATSVTSTTTGMSGLARATLCASRLSTSSCNINLPLSSMACRPISRARPPRC